MKQRDMSEDYLKHLENLKKFYNKYIRTKKDINPEDWDFYRDYHLQVFGFEPTFRRFGQ